MLYSVIFFLLYLSTFNFCLSNLCSISFVLHCHYDGLTWTRVYSMCMFVTVFLCSYFICNKVMINISQVNTMLCFPTRPHKDVRGKWPLGPVRAAASIVCTVPIEANELSSVCTDQCALYTKSDPCMQNPKRLVL